MMNLAINMQVSDVPPCSSQMSHKEALIELYPEQFIQKSTPGQEGLTHSLYKVAAAHPQPTGRFLNFRMKSKAQF